MNRSKIDLTKNLEDQCRIADALHGRDWGQTQH